MIRELTDHLRGGVKILNAYSCGIKPCVDCRSCCKTPGCPQEDGMRDLAPYLIDSDNIVIASPIYFSELTGPLLSVASRLQMFYASERFLHRDMIPKKKIGGVILCGGGDGAPDIAEKMARSLLRAMHADYRYRAFSLKTDFVPSCEDARAKQAVWDMAAGMNAER